MKESEITMRLVMKHNNLKSLVDLSSGKIVAVVYVVLLRNLKLEILMDTVLLSCVLLL